MIVQNIITFIIILTCPVKSTNVTELLKICSDLKNGPSLEVMDLVGVWMTVYTQPNTISCFSMNIRSTTELEREQLVVKYGNFSGVVDWDQCFLQVETAHGKHFLQGDGNSSGVLENIYIAEDDKGRFDLQHQNPDQWTIFGRRGSELLLMKDCSGEALAVFARAPYWPATTDIYAILHRGGVKPMTKKRLLCEPLTDCYINNYYNKRRT